MYFVLIPGVTLLSAANLLVYITAHVAVPLFLCISGCVLALHYSGEYSVASFYQRRMQTILLPYIIFSLLYMLVPAGTPAVFGQWAIPSPEEAVFNLLTGSGYYHLWFFLLIIQFYLLYPLIIALYDAYAAEVRQEHIVAAALIVQILWSAGAHAGGAVFGQIWYALLIRVFLSHIFYFTLGIYAARHYGAIASVVRAIQGRAILALALAATAGISLLWVPAFINAGSFDAIPPSVFIIQRIVEPFYYLLLFILLYAAAGLLAQSTHAVPLFLQTLGDRSYGVYLVHAFVTTMIIMALGSLGVGWGDWIFYPVLFVSVVAVSTAGVGLLRRLPHGDLVTGSRARRKEAVPGAAGALRQESAPDR